jgi:hypothetical protein
MNSTDYVRIDTLPLDVQPRFTEWLFRQTRPVVPSEINATGQPAACAYAWDFALWLSENKPTALSDYLAT